MNNKIDVELIVDALENYVAREKEKIESNDLQYDVIVARVSAIIQLEYQITNLKEWDNE